MSTWRRRILEEFPEFGHAPEEWNLIDAAMELATWLERATQRENADEIDRVLKILLWADAQASAEERFIYFVQDVLWRTVAAPVTRAAFATRLDQQAFGKLAGYIEYLTSREVILDISASVRAAKSGRRARRTAGSP